LKTKPKQDLDENQENKNNLLAIKINDYQQNIVETMSLQNSKREAPIKQQLE